MVDVVDDVDVVVVVVTGVSGPTGGCARTSEALATAGWILPDGPDPKAERMFWVIVTTGAIGQP